MKTLGDNQSEKAKRLMLNRYAAVKSRRKKKEEEEYLRVYLEFLTRSKQHLELKLVEYEKIVKDQVGYNTALQAQMYRLLVDNISLQARVKASET